MKGVKNKYNSLDELGKVARGKSRHRPRNAPFLYGGPYPFIQTADITNSEFHITQYTQTYSEEGLAQSKLWKPGTLCIVNAGVNTGDNAILNFKACFPDSVIAFIADESKSNTRFVKYYLDSIKTQIRTITMGATQDNLSVSKLLTFKVPAFPVDSQKKIAAILSAYDELIENNQRRIAILETMAEEIYREWFVRMRFPGHDQVKMIKGVPEGWEVKKLGDITNILMGQSPKSEFYNTEGDGLPFHQGVGTYGPRFPKREMFCSVKGREAKTGDILFSVRAPVGRLNIADCDLIIGRGLAAINHKQKLNSYLFYTLKTCFGREDIIGNGAIFNSVGKDELLKFPILSPNRGLDKKFNDKVTPMDTSINSLFLAIDRLKQSRDLLLPRLISGKLDVESLNITFPPGMRDHLEKGNG